MLFGKTVFEYGQICRMEHAMRLLRDKRLPIGLVSNAIGYAHQTTFSSAFKQHSGYRPKEIRSPRMQKPAAGVSAERTSRVPGRESSRNAAARRSEIDLRSPSGKIYVTRSSRTLQKVVSRVHKKNITGYARIARITGRERIRVPVAA
jgi:Helix-turn-helix domain